MDEGMRRTLSIRAHNARRRTLTVLGALVMGHSDRVIVRVRAAGLRTLDDGGNFRVRIGFMRCWALPRSGWRIVQAVGLPTSFGLAVIRARSGDFGGGKAIMLSTAQRCIRSGLQVLRLSGATLSAV